MGIPVALSPERVTFEGRDAFRRLGLIALATDLTTERDFARVFAPDRAGIFTARVAYENPTTPENLRRIAPRLTAAADLILPGEPLDAICYSCTAASVVIGDAEIARAVHAARPGVPVVTPTAAATAGLQALGARRIAILTPYLEETSRPMAEYFATSFEVERLECFGIEDDRDMARIGQETIVSAAARLNGPDIDALFVSCTALPALAAVSEIEARTGKPVVTSNQASAWAMARLAGLPLDPGIGGRLFAAPLAAGTFGVAA